MLAWPPKDPQEVLDYQLNWTRRLDGDQVSTSVWAFSGPDAVLVIGSSGGTAPSNTASTTTVWLSAGTLNRTYTVTNTITTTAGRTMEQSALIPIKAK